MSVSYSKAERGVNALPAPRLAVANEDFRLKVLFVDDDQFALRLIADGLRSRLVVRTASNTADALDELETFEAHAVVTDLDLGGGPDGGRLLQKVHDDYPWIGRVILSAHSSPRLAVANGVEIPPDTVYLVKSQITSLDSIFQAISDSLSGSVLAHNVATDGSDIVEISSNQAVVLRLVAEGLSNAAIAQELGFSVRAAERLVQRLFQTLGITSDSNVNSRVVAATMYRNGLVTVR